MVVQITINDQGQVTSVIGSCKAKEFKSELLKLKESMFL